MNDIDPSDKPSAFLPDLVGGQLSSVTFVQNYVQLEFDGKRFTAYEWPVVVEPEKRTSFGEPGYRDALYRFIAREVSRLVESETTIVVEFPEGCSLELDVKLGDGHEKLIYEENFGGKYAWAYWPSK